MKYSRERAGGRFSDPMPGWRGWGAVIFGACVSPVAVFCLFLSVGAVMAPPVMAKEGGITVSDLLKKLKEAEKKAIARRTATLKGAVSPKKRKKKKRKKTKSLPPRSATPPPEETTAKEEALGTTAAKETPSKKGAPALLFGAKEVRSANLKPFPKWTGMVDRYFSGKELKGGSCKKTKFNKCYLAAWKSFLKELQGRDKKTQIKKVNDFMNKAKYIVDMKNYQTPDYWATPGQFFNKDGDCEDYAIAKYMSLRALGFENEEMRIVVLQNLNLKVPHAVLAVYTDDGPVLLDNQVPQVIPAKNVFHYKPVYSINEDFWWLYRG